MANNEGRRNRLTLGRLNGLSDGVFAIVITILVLGLDVPRDHDFAQQGILGFLGRIEDQLLPYCVSFTLIASYWVLHHVMLNYMDRCNRMFIWLNLAFMLPLSLSPWVTGIRSEYPCNLNVAILFGAVQLAVYLMLWVIWHYGLKTLTNHPIPRRVVLGMDLRIAAAVGLTILGVALVPFNERISTVVFVCTPLMFVHHHSVDHHRPDEAPPG
ncbi:MAG: DUF1211 domain-containing protein [Mariniblastus sp.]|nr:DUF1211 domain-containing protein [Mariniblastus sp.]